MSVWVRKVIGSGHIKDVVRKTIDRWDYLVTGQIGFEVVSEKGPKVGLVIDIFINTKKDYRCTVIFNDKVWVTLMIVKEIITIM